MTTTSKFPVEEEMRKPAASNSFSMHRVALFASRYLASHGRTLLLTACAFLALSIVVELLMVLTDINYDQLLDYKPSSGIDPTWGMTATMCLVLYVMLAAVGGSMFFSDYSTKENRLSELTLPVTAGERFFTYLMIFVVALGVVAIASVYVADMMRVAVIWIFYPEARGFTHLIPLHKLLELGGYHTTLAADIDDINDTAMSYAAVMCVGAVFALGSICFHKHPLLKTAVAIYAIMQIIGLIAMLSAYIFFDGRYTLKSSGETSTGAIVANCLSVLIAVALIYWLSFARMKENEVDDRW